MATALDNPPVPAKGKNGAPAASSSSSASDVAGPRFNKFQEAMRGFGPARVKKPGLPSEPIQSSSSSSSAPISSSSSSSAPSSSSSSSVQPASSSSSSKPKASKKEVDTAKLVQETAAAVGAATGKAVAEAFRKSQPGGDTQPEEVKLEGEDAETLRVLEHLAGKKEYSGEPEKFKVWVAKRHAYKTDWEKSNPGQEFDEDADEHSAFFENAPEINDDVYRKAERELLRKEIAEDVRKELNPQIEEVTRRTTAAEVHGKVAASEVSAGKAFFAAVDKDAKILKEDGSVDPVELKNLRETDPVRADILIGAAAHVESFARTANELFYNTVQADGKNPAHASVFKFLDTCEQWMAETAEEDRPKKDGKVFADHKAYEAMAKDERAKHWTFTADDIAHAYAAQIAESVKRQVETERARVEKTAIAMGFKRETAPISQQTSSSSAASSSSSSQQAKPLSPDAGGQPQVKTTVTPSAGGEKNRLGGFLAGMFPRK